MTISEYLKEQLKRHGRRASFAKKVGVTEPTVARWLSGRSLPDFESCLRIALHLKLEPAKVFRMAEKPSYEDLYTALFRENHQVQEVDLYKDDEDIELYKQLQGLIKHGALSKIKVQIELLEAEKDLIESEVGLRQMADQSVYVFCICTPTRSKVFYINAAYKRIWGRSRENIFTDLESFLSTIHPEDAERVYAMTRKQALGEATIEDYRIVHPDGSICWVRDRSFVVGNSAEKRRIASVVVDLTDRRRLDMELRESEERYRRLVENLKDEYFFYSHDTDGRVTYVSPSITHVLGYSQDDFLTHYSEYITEEFIEQAVHHRRLSIQGQEQPSYEVEIFHKEGGTRRFRITEFPVRNKEGKVRAVEGVAHDITEQKKMEEALRSSEERLKVGQSLADIGIWDLDVQADAGTCSRQYLKLYGVTPEDRTEVGDDLYHFLSPKKWLEMVHPDDRDLVMTTREKAIEGAGPYELEFRVIWTDGTVHWLLSRARTFSDESGKCVRMIGVNLDITDKKRVEERLRQSP